MNHEERIASLSEMAYYVTQQNGTERPFTGILNKEYRRGDYFCIVCDTLLFTDQMKFDSGCGWPAFHTEHHDAGIHRIIDTSHGMTELKFDAEIVMHTLGMFSTMDLANMVERYCINSVAMRFEVKE